MKARTVLVLTVVVILGVAGVYLGVQWADANYEYQGSLIEPAMPAFPIALAESDGELFSLQAHQGKVVMLYFGYTNCPDLCPATLSDFKKIHDSLGERADEIEFVMVTIDPERDTLEKTAQYVSAFDSSFIGLSASETDLQDIWDGYFVFRAKSGADSAAGYLMDHTTRTYVIDKQGNLRLTYPFGIEYQAMLLDVEHLLDE
ncbi:MAG: SCO family protein [Chloroflexi bacterium]|nr:MAG: SCO family protein [Chloroflexota bacterium]MBL1194205.1 SCO family protein [Chloroflexota bacterium]NOH11498.1 SCO family protein [Chloroflexota bacterium]